MSTHLPLEPRNFQPTTSIFGCMLYDTFPTSQTCVPATCARIKAGRSPPHGLWTS